jgi:hypothetical protein
MMRRCSRIKISDRRSNIQGLYDGQLSSRLVFRRGNFTPSGEDLLRVSAVPLDGRTMHVRIVLTCNACSVYS